MDRNFILTLIIAELSVTNIPEVNLMRAVIKECFLDLLIISQRKKYNKKKQDAKAWFELESDNFYLICQLAVIDPKRIKRLYEFVTKYLEGLNGIESLEN
jgi:hypothetical protein